MAGTYLAQAIAATNEASFYDTNVKYLLADKQILAWILKYAVKEFRDMEIREIISCIGDDIEIGIRPVAPGLSNLGRVQGANTEDSVPGEGTVYYDIRFTVYHRGMAIRFLINLEAQKWTEPSKLGYHLENRIIFYLSRMVSAQNQTEFFKSDYDSLKPVRSIWICLGNEAAGDYIEEISLVRDNTFGKEADPEEIGLMKGIIIHIREGKGMKESRNRLIHMLEELFSQKSVKEKKRILTEEYGMIMTEELEGRMQNVCNWSEYFMEAGLKEGLEKGILEGREKGIKEGREEGREEGIEAFVLDNLEEQVPGARILEKLQRRFQLNEETASMYYERFKVSSHQ